MLRGKLQRTIIVAIALNVQGADSSHEGTDENLCDATPADLGKPRSKRATSSTTTEIEETVYADWMDTDDFSGDFEKLVSKSIQHERLGCSSRKRRSQQWKQKHQDPKSFRDLRIMFYQAQEDEKMDRLGDSGYIVQNCLAMRKTGGSNHANLSSEAVDWMLDNLSITEEHQERIALAASTQQQHHHHHGQQVQQ